MFGLGNFVKYIKTINNNFKSIKLSLFIFSFLSKNIMSVSGLYLFIFFLFEFFIRLTKI